MKCNTESTVGNDVAELKAEIERLYDMEETYRGLRQQKQKELRMLMHGLTMKSVSEDSD